MRLAMRFQQIRQIISELPKNIQSEITYRVWASGIYRQKVTSRNILFVDDLLPDPTFGAGYPRAAGIIQALIDCGWNVSIYPMQAKSEHYQPVAEQFKHCVNLLPTGGSRGLSRILRSHALQYKVVLISRPGPMKAFAKIVAARPGIAQVTNCIYDAEALIARREVLRRKVFNRPMSQEEERDLIKTELDLASPAQAIWAVTDLEAATFAKHLSVPAHVVSHGLPVRTDVPGAKGRRDFLFVGRLTGDWIFSPNADSLIWFVEEVMPALDEMIGDGYRLRVVGLSDNAIRERVESERVVFEGIVQNTTPLYDSSRVFVAPTRFSAGLPFKVCETLAMGLPCVATDQLQEQTKFVPGRDIESASSLDPKAFASACARLYVEV